MKSVLLIILLIFSLPVEPVVAMEEDAFADFGIEDNYIEISDPLEPMNRVFFQFNDKLYNYVLSPVAKSYAALLPADVRGVIGNAFHNILAPVRVVNCLLQAKFSQSGVELMRFVINTTAGSGGLADPAKEVFNLHSVQEDLGQTLGKYGIGEGIYICWPFLGPSNVRDSIGMIGDSFLNPLSYIFYDDAHEGLIAHSTKLVNKTSLSLGEYEAFVESSFDPYIAMRDFYTDIRKSAVDDINIRNGGFPKQSGYFDFGVNPVGTLAEKTNDMGSESPTVVAIDEKNKYFIQVGVFTDKEKTKQLITQLIASDTTSELVEYQREGYSFYGVQVAGGNTFTVAKNVEIALNDAGFIETHVLMR